MQVRGPPVGAEDDEGIDVGDQALGNLHAGGRDTVCQAPNLLPLTFKQGPDSSSGRQCFVFFQKGILKRWGTSDQSVSHPSLTTISVQFRTKAVESRATAKKIVKLHENASYGVEARRNAVQCTHWVLQPSSLHIFLANIENCIAKVNHVPPGTRTAERRPGDFQVASKSRHPSHGA
jgi:hypothetical protein